MQSYDAFTPNSDASPRQIAELDYAAMEFHLEEARRLRAQAMAHHIAMIGRLLVKPFKLVAFWLRKNIENQKQNGAHLSINIAKHSTTVK